MLWGSKTSNEKIASKQAHEDPQGALGVTFGGPPWAHARGPLAKVKQVSWRDLRRRPHLGPLGTTEGPLTIFRVGLVRDFPQWSNGCLSLGVRHGEK